MLLETSRQYYYSESSKNGQWIYTSFTNRGGLMDCHFGISIHAPYVQIAAESAVPANTQVVLFGQGKSNSVQHMNPNLASHLHKTPCSFGMSCT